MGFKPAVTINEIESYFNEHGIPEGIVQLDACMRIIDPVKFVESSICILRAHPGNKYYRPYYERLLSFYKYCKK